MECPKNMEWLELENTEHCQDYDERLSPLYCITGYTWTCKQDGITLMIQYNIINCTYSVNMYHEYNTKQCTKIATEIVNLAPTAHSMSHFTTQYTLASVVFPLCWLPGCVAATPQPLEPPAPLWRAGETSCRRPPTPSPHLGQAQLCGGINKNSSTPCQCAPYVTLNAQNLK